MSKTDYIKGSLIRGKDDEELEAIRAAKRNQTQETKRDEDNK